MHNGGLTNGHHIRNQHVTYNPRRHVERRGVMKMRKENNMNDTLIYISGKVSGTDDYMERFAKAEKKLTEQGFSVINPAKMDGVLMRIL